MNNYKLISIPESLHGYIAWLIKAKGLGLGAEESLERELERMCIRQYSPKPRKIQKKIDGFTAWHYVPSLEIPMSLHTEESYTLQRITVDDTKGAYLSDESH